MSALRMEKELADSSLSLTKSTFASRGATAFDISRMVPGLVTVNGNIRAAKERKRKTKTRPDHTPMAHTQHNRENQKPNRRVISGLTEHLEVFLNTNFRRAVILNVEAVAIF